MEDRQETSPTSGSGPRDVVDGDADALRTEVLRLRDEIAGAASRNEVLEDRIQELETQVEELAAGLERYENLANKPAVKAALSVTRPVRRLLDRRRATS